MDPLDGLFLNGILCYLPLCILFVPNQPTAMEQSIEVLGSAILPPSRVPEQNPRTLYVVRTYLSFVSDQFPPCFQTYLPCTVYHLISPSSLPFTC